MFFQQLHCTLVHISATLPKAGKLIKLSGNQYDCLLGKFNFFCIFGEFQIFPLTAWQRLRTATVCKNTGGNCNEDE